MGKSPVTVVVSCSNQQEVLPALFERIDEVHSNGGRDWRFVVVDDGSTDGTFADLLEASRRRAWLQVVRHPEKLGLGASMRTGFAASDSPVVCTMDTDSDYSPMRLKHLVKVVNQGSAIATASAAPADVDSGRARGGFSRLLPGFGRQWIERLAPALTGSFRAYRRDAIDRFGFRADGAAALVEIMIRAIASGADVRQVAIPRDGGNGQPAADGERCDATPLAEPTTALVRSTAISWPRKYDLFGVSVSATTPTEALNVIIDAAARGVPAIVDHMPVAGLTEGSRDVRLGKALNAFDLALPDGQPVRWALNWFHDTRLEQPVVGRDLMLRLCRRAAEEGIGIYLYGGSPEIVARLERNLTDRCPGLKVVGCESPPFRPLTDAEDRAAVERINQSGAGLVFIGLGCPKQELFAYEHRHRIKPVQMCVGAAFDFLAGASAIAPKWMSDHGLEWVFRLGCEPRRLWRRYLVWNSLFLWAVAKQILRRGRPRELSVPRVRTESGLKFRGGS